MMGRAVGIDLGTTNSVIAVLEAERPEVIANTEGGRTTPSVVAFRDNNETIGGSAGQTPVCHESHQNLLFGEAVLSDAVTTK
jgi:molecular chaperone DnaK